MSKKAALPNARGATLMELMIVIAVLAVTMMIFASQMTSSHQAANGIERELAFMDLVHQVQAFTDSHGLCTGVLAGTAPVYGSSFAAVTAGLNLTTGASFQNGLLTITQLRWAQVINLSPTESVGFIQVQADIGGSGGFIGVGGNIRNFPAPGSTPPGIMVNMRMDPVTHLVTECGPPDPNSTTQHFTFPITVSINDSSDYTGTVTLPTPYADNNYTIICTMINPFPGTSNGGINYGNVTPTSQTATGFVWHYWQERGNYIPNGTTLTANCITNHP